MTLNHPIKQVPTPAHSSPVLPVHSKPIPTEISAGVCDSATDEEQNSSFPLDLCMKRQEPTFEVTTSVTSSFIPSTTTTAAKKKQFITTDSNVTGANKMAAPKKRGRKPKAIQMSAATPPVQPEKVRKIKRVSYFFIYLFMYCCRLHLKISNLVYDKIVRMIFIQLLENLH